MSSSCAKPAVQPFRDMCQEAKAGMGLPVYVATGPVSKKDGATHAKLHEMGCVTYRNITGYDMLQDWELAGMDQFLLAEAETHVSMRCSAADTVASDSLRMRAAAASEVFIATSDAFLDVPDDADERGRVRRRRTKMVQDHRRDQGGDEDRSRTR